MSDDDRNQNEVEDSPSEDGLVLYHALGSSYSQRVLMALYEKNLKFESCLIDLYVGGHLEPYFMDMNPKAEVPVLVHGKKIVVESSKILDYLDEQFSDENRPSLIPWNIKEGARVNKIRKVLESLPLPAITLGVVYHPQLSVNSKMTDIERQLRLSAMKGSNSLVDSFIIKHPEFEDRYKEKKEKYRECFASIKDVAFVRDALKKVEKALDIVENELGTNDGETWLCGINFTVADILLVVVLRHIDHLGLITWFFPNDVRPLIMKYYERVQNRESLIQTLKYDFTDDDLPGSILSYTTLFVALGLIVFAIVAACAHLKNH